MLLWLSKRPLAEIQNVWWYNNQTKLMGNERKKERRTLGNVAIHICLWMGKWQEAPRHIVEGLCLPNKACAWPNIKFCKYPPTLSKACSTSCIWKIFQTKACYTLHNVTRIPVKWRLRKKKKNLKQLRCRSSFVFRSGESPINNRFFVVVFANYKQCDCLSHYPYTLPYKVNFRVDGQHAADR